MAIHLDCWAVDRILEADFFNKLAPPYSVTSVWSELPCRRG
jgi:hypothetical protein